MLRFTPEATAGINANYLGGPPSLADGYSFPALADLDRAVPDAARRAPSTTTCGRRARPSATSSRPPGVDVRRVLADGMLHGFLNLSADVGARSTGSSRMMATTVAHPTTVPAT